MRVFQGPPPHTRGGPAGGRVHRAGRRACPPHSSWATACSAPAFRKKAPQKLLPASRAPPFPWLPVEAEAEPETLRCRPVPPSSQPCPLHVLHVRCPQSPVLGLSPKASPEPLRLHWPSKGGLGAGQEPSPRRAPWPPRPPSVGPRVPGCWAATRETGTFSVTPFPGNRRLRTLNVGRGFQTL